MWTIFVMIGIVILGVISAYLPSGYSIVCFYGSYLIGFIMAIVSLVFFFLYKKEKKPIIWPFLSIVLYVLYVSFFGNIYHMIHGLNEVKKKFQEYPYSIQIKGIRKENQLVSGYDCHYVYDVVLDHSNDSFQAGYCADDGWISLYKVFHNYDELYLPKLLEEFSKNHPNSMYLEKDMLDDRFRWYKLYYSSNDCQTAQEFSRYLEEKSYQIPYTIYFHNIDDNTFEDYHTWNHRPASIFCDLY